MGEVPYRRTVFKSDSCCRGEEPPMLSRGGGSLGIQGYHLHHLNMGLTSSKRQNQTSRLPLNEPSQDLKLRHLFLYLDITLTNFLHIRRTHNDFPDLNSEEIESQYLAMQRFYIICCLNFLPPRTKPLVAIADVDNPVIEVTVVARRIMITPRPVSGENIKYFIQASHLRGTIHIWMIAGQNSGTHCTEKTY